MTTTSSVGNKQMSLTRVFNAPREAVWRAWTDPEEFSYWFGGSKMSVPLQTIEMDVRPGGEWKATMVPEQGDPMPFFGKYLEVQPPERLVMTFGNPSNPADPNVEVLTVTLKELNQGTEVTLHQAGHLPDEQYPKLVAGYGTFMDAMEELLSGLQ